MRHPASPNCCVYKLQIFSDLFSLVSHNMKYVVLLMPVHLLLLILSTFCPCSGNASTLLLPTIIFIVIIVFCSCCGNVATLLATHHIHQHNQSYIVLVMGILVHSLLPTIFFNTLNRILFLSWEYWYTHCYPLYSPTQSYIVLVVGTLLHS